MSSATTPLVIGQGSHQYEVIDLWGRVPEPQRATMGTTHGVIEDAQGRIFIHHTGSPSVYIFSPEGDFLGAWGEAYAGGAHGMFYHRAADGAEHLYLAATGLGFVAKTTLDGKELLRIGTPPRADIYNDEMKFVPTEAAVTADGEIFIADGYGQPWVHRYTAAGEYVSSFGGFGEAQGQLNNPHGIRIDSRSGVELLLVADRGNHRLQWFDREGKVVRVLDRDLRMPCNAKPWGDELYVPDLFSRLSVFDKDDKLIAHLGDRPECWTKQGWPNLPASDWVAGAFSSPHDMHIDGRGNIYVAEWLSNGTPKLTKLVRL